MLVVVVMVVVVVGSQCTRNVQCNAHAYKTIKTIIKTIKTIKTIIKTIIHIYVNI